MLSVTSSFLFRKNTIFPNGVVTSVLQPANFRFVVTTVFLAHLCPHSSRFYWRNHQKDSDAVRGAEILLHSIAYGRKSSLQEWKLIVSRHN